MNIEVNDPGFTEEELIFINNGYYVSFKSKAEYKKWKKMSDRHNEYCDSEFDKYLKSNPVIAEQIEENKVDAQHARDAIKIEYYRRLAHGSYTKPYSVKHFHFGRFDFSEGVFVYQAD